MVFNKCCCCVELRAGTIVIAILQIIQGVGGLGAGQGWSNIIGMIVAVAAGVCLLYGAIAYNPTATLVNLIFSMIGIVFCLIISIMAFSVIAAIPRDHPQADAATGGAIGTGVLFLIVAIVEIYLWICVYSFYKALKSESITTPA